MSHAATNWAILQKGLKPATKIVLWFLCDRHNPDFGCFPSQARLADDCEMSARSVRDHLTILEDRGLIRRIKRSGGAGAYISDRYIFAFESGFDSKNDRPAAKSATGKNASNPAAKSATGHRQNLPPNLVRVNPVREPVNDDFDILWKYYPRKVGKGAAKKEYGKALKKTTPDKIKSALGEFIRCQQGTETRLIPHLRTWLHQERWDDVQSDAINRHKTTDDQLDALNATTDQQLDNLFPKMRAIK